MAETPAAELRQAAKTLRDGDCLIHLRKADDWRTEKDAQRLTAPLAAWLESWGGVEIREDGPYSDDWAHALKVARAINGRTS